MRGEHRAGRLEGRVTPAELAVFLPYRKEPTIVRIPPVSARPLALLDDRLDRRERGAEFGDGDQLRPPEQLRSGLGARRADEDRRLAELLDQSAKAVGDATVQVADRGELLAPRQRLGLRDRIAWGRGRG